MGLFKWKKKSAHKEANFGVYQILAGKMRNHYINVIDYNEEAIEGYIYDELLEGWYNETSLIYGLDFTKERDLKYIGTRQSFIYEKPVRKKDVLNLASQIMAGLISNPQTAEQYMESEEYKQHGNLVEVISRASIIYAETLLKEIDKRYENSPC